VRILRIPGFWAVVLTLLATAATARAQVTPAAGKAAQDRVSVYVFTATTITPGAPRNDSAQREQMVARIARLLQRGKVAHLVPTAKAAAVTVEVTYEKEEQAFDLATQIINGQNPARADNTMRTRWFRYATVRAGSRTVELKGQSSDQTLGLAVERWLKENAATISK
jgi:hypothetical protein